MPPRVYNPDHTAHIRQRLTQMAVHSAVALVVAGAATAITALITIDGGGPRWLVTAVWLAGGIVAGVAALSLLITLAAWLVYRRRRQQLDAAGAQAVGEFRVRLARSRRDES